MGHSARARDGRCFSRIPAAQPVWHDHAGLGPRKAFGRSRSGADPAALDARCGRLEWTETILKPAVPFAIGRRVNRPSADVLIWTRGSAVALTISACSSDRFHRQTLITRAGGAPAMVGEPFSDAEHAVRRKKARRAVFLAVRQLCCLGRIAQARRSGSRGGAARATALTRPPRCPRSQPLAWLHPC